MPLVPLLPNTGVQYAFLPGLFTDDALKSAVARLNFEVGFGLGGRIRAVDGAAADARRDDEEESPFEDDPAEKSGDRYAVRADPERVVDMILADGGWLPVPFDAVSPLFTMLWLGRNERKWDAVLAVDTTVSDSLNSDSLTAECVPGTYRIEPVKSALFWKNKAVVGWLDRHHRRMFGGRAAAARPEESLGGLQAHLAGFYSFLASLKDFPQVTFSALNQAPVNANLVVDLGNSRTCCVLQETNADGEPRWSRLELRNPAKPLQAETRPVDSRLAFMPPVHEVLDGASTFRTLSLIRLGQAAMDVIGESNEDVGVRGMSSPKRYMWDSDRRPQPWQFARSPRRAEASAGAADSHPISGVLLKHIEVKTPFDALKRPVDGGYPDYSRKTIALFVFLELLEQAYRQVNSVEHRGATSHLPGATRRRVLRNLVILHPAGMHTDELTEFRRAAQRAASLFAAFHTDPAAFVAGEAVVPSERRLEPDGGSSASTHPIPNVDMACDEGLALQMCWLYGVSEQRFLGRAGHFVRVFGRQRGDLPTLRIASLDIGGGTTDLAIADYWTQTGDMGSIFEMKQLFHDGVSFGGDEVVRILLERVVFPAIADQMRIPRDEWNRLFSTQDVQQGEWLVLRRRLVPMLWAPLAHSILGRMETDGSIDQRIGNILDKMSSTAVGQLNKELASLRGSEGVGSVLDVHLRIGERHLAHAAAEALEKSLRPYCDIISQFGCDVLLLGGRPTSLPAVRRIIEEAVPLPPGSIVTLGEQIVGDWYPFIQNGRIGDSKTCGVVGAAVAVMAKSGQGNFAVRDMGDPNDSVPSILGIMNVHDRKFEQELFTDGANVSQPVPLILQSQIIGSQRMRGKGAVAKPIYDLRRNPRIQRHLATAKERNPGRLQVRLERGPGRGDVIRGVAEVTGRISYTDDKGTLREFIDDPGSVVVRLRTMMRDEEYWLDSGRFDALPEPGK